MVAPPSDLPRARRAGYRLLGPALDYILHLRPAEWPIMAAHTTLGAWLAWTASGRTAALFPFVIGVLLWVIFLNGGTLAINSAFDRDEGDIAYLRRPPVPPPHLFAWGLGLMLTGFLASVWLLPWGYVAVYAVCLAMSVLYSVPPFRLKAVAGADWVINMIGFGTLTPVAGWMAGGGSIPGWGVILLAGFCPLFAGFYPLTQIYQMDEDRARGDRTLALGLGVRRSLGVATGSVLIAFALFFWAALRVAGGQAVRLVLLALALGCWLAVLLPWLQFGQRWTPARHQRGMYLALGAWAVTDVVIAAAWAA